MDEAFDHWYRPKAMNPYCGVFMEHFLEDVTAMVLDAYNHPSVILYSIGNEIPAGTTLSGVIKAQALHLRPVIVTAAQGFITEFYQVLVSSFGHNCGILAAN